MAERQPKRRRPPEDADMTVVLAHPASERTNDICGLLVRADFADNNYVEEGSWTRTGEREDREWACGRPCDHFGAQRGEP